MIEGMTFRMSSDTLTKDIEAMQGLVNTARVQAGSQYAAIESAVNYTTDLTAQYELGYNTVNDVNFSMEQHTWLRTKFYSRLRPPCWHKPIQVSKDYYN